MESFVLHEIELKNIDVSSPVVRSLSLNDEDITCDQIYTKLGQVNVYKQSFELTKNRPIFITYHDIGLNSISNFQAFFNYSDMKLMLESISVLHICAIGQEDNAQNYPSVPYPTLDDLADQIVEICDYYQVKSFIGFGVGVGANILSRFGLKHSKYLDGLVLINPTSSAASWTEWFYQKLNIYYLSSAINTSINTFPESTKNYLMWYHFGRQDETRNYDLIELFKNHFSGKTINAYNLSLLIDSYLKRTDLDIDRINLKKNFKCPILIICGSMSPHIEDSVYFNSRIDPSNSTWLKLQNCGMVLEEQPGKVSEALKLFIQGLGYALTSYEKKRNMIKNGILEQNSYLRSIDETETKNDYGDAIENQDSDKCSTTEKVEFAPYQDDFHIVENPIQNC